ncbi:hypothetical protein [Paenibacillus silvae]|uniref:hypothetical protein n=1 Tax=Paenibacillus silvae TaxID=1325358 RepID=UPI0020056C0B|nr:hypothetical protein [Paenibacillus silvae]
MIRRENDNLSSAGYKITTKNSTQYEKKMRRRIVYIFIPLILGIAVYFISNMEVWTYFFRFQLQIVYTVLLTVSAFFALFTYLQTGFKTKGLVVDTQNNNFYVERIEEYEASLNSFDNKLAQLNDQMELLNHAGRKVDNIEITKNEKEHIFAQLQTKIENEAIDNFIDNIKSKIGEYNNKAELTSLLATGFNNIRERLTKEVNDLNRRGNVNLVLGIFITFAGIILLYYFVYGVKVEHKSILDFSMYFIPKLALVVFIETFAYFFLSLYKVSLSEIKYYQNELTKIDLNNVALLTAINLNSEQMVTNLLGTFVGETNEKGQPADNVELNDSKIIKNVKESVSSIFDKGLAQFNKDVTK